MLDVQFIRDNPDLVRRAIQQKGTEDVSVVSSILEADMRHRGSITELQKIRTEANEESKKIGQLMRDGEQEAALIARTNSSKLKVRTKEADEQVREHEAILNVLLLVPSTHDPKIVF